MAKRDYDDKPWYEETNWDLFHWFCKTCWVYKTILILGGMWVGGKIIELLEEPFVKPSWGYYLNNDPTRHPFETKRLDSKNHRIIYKTPEEIDKDERTFKRLKERDKSNIKAPSSSSSQLDIEELIELYMD